MKYYPKFPPQRLTNEALYEKIYSSTEFTDPTMRNLFFRLEKLLEKFLILENSCRNEFYMINCLLNELNLRKLGPLFTKYSENFESQLSKWIGVDNDYFYSRYLLEVNKFNALKLSDFKIKKVKLKSRAEGLNKATLYLSLFFITELICNYLNQAVIFNKYNLNGVKNTISGLVEKIDISGILNLIYGKDEYDYVLELYYNLLECFSKFDDARNYYVYKNSVEKNVKRLSNDEISFHYSRMMGYCIFKQKLSSFSLEFKKELFCVYNEFLENEYYKNSKVDYLPHELYRTILLLALDLGELNWVKKFIDKYSTRVEFQLRESMFNYGYAFYYFNIGSYEKSLNYIDNISKESFGYRFDLRHLAIGINYEMGNLEEVLRLVHSYRKSLIEHEAITDEFKASNLEYLKFVEKIVSYKYGNNKIEIDFLKEKIFKTDYLFQKDWLLKKCDLLIEKESLYVMEKL
jgi:hypothetical protein